MSNFSIRSQSLNDWLCYLESIHPSEIELGLTRVKQVADKLNLLSPKGRIVLVAGTNGKGSTCAYLERLLLAGGHTTGVFSSPHLIRYNERVRINGNELGDQFHVDALRYVEQGRGDTPLTYFEFNTLAALKLMTDAKVDYLIMEVGLGGRLDSTNILDAELAVITSIDLDHQAWLGDTRDQVGFEKAGIFRPNQQVVCGEPNPPESLIERARQLHCNIAYKGHDFRFELSNQHWHWHSGDRRHRELPLTKLPMTNAATAIKAFEQLGHRLAGDRLAQVIASTALPGRLQSISSSPEVVLDVAHNPEAGRYLALWLANQRQYDRVHCVCAMLGDKDSQSTLEVVAKTVDLWYLADLNCPRGAKAPTLAANLANESIVGCYSSVIDALQQAKKAATAKDLILVFGSFFTVAEVLTDH